MVCPALQLPEELWIETKAGLFTWSDAHTVGIPEFDEDHRHLLAITDRLYEVLAARRKRAVLEKILQEMQVQTEKHFHAEEAYMRVILFPHFPEHEAEHQSMSAQLRQFRQRCSQADERLEVELAHFVENRLLHHVTVTDRTYACAERKFDLPGWLARR
jgi:hemerythrin-like metal-binding protein